MPVPVQPVRHARIGSDAAAPRTVTRLVADTLLPSDASIGSKTGPPGDVTPPTITAGPTVIELTETQARIEWSLDEPGSGQVEYSTSPTFSPSTFTNYQVCCTFSTHRQYVPSVGQPPLIPGTQYYYRVYSEDASMNMRISPTGTFTTPGGTEPTPDPTSLPFLGIPIAATDKSNRQLRQGAHAIVFTAKGGTVTRFALQMTNRSDPYGAGTGGTFRVVFRTVGTDGKPTSTQVGGASVSVSPGIITSPENFPISWAWTSNAPALTAGTRYAALIENVHSSPNSNYSSLNFPWLSGGDLNDQPLQQHLGIRFWNGSFYTSPFVWTTADAHVAAFDLTYSDGRHDGFGGIRGVGSGSNDADRIGQVSSTCRWTFTHRGADFTATTLAARFMGSGTPSGDVRVNGVSRATASLSSSGAWHRGTLSAPVTIVDGDAVEVRFSGTSQTMPLLFFQDNGAVNDSDRMLSYPYDRDGTNPHRADDGGGAAWSAWYAHTAYQAYLQGTAGGEEPEPEPEPEPAVVTNLTADQITDDAARITWNLDRQATGHTAWDTASHAGPFSDGTAVMEAYASTNFPAETTLTWSNHIQNISGLDPDTQYRFRVFGEDAQGTPYVSAEATFTTAADPTVPTLVKPIYGVPAFGMSLNNGRVGYSGWSWAYRWTAEFTGQVSSLRWYLVSVEDGSSYAAGDGGIMRLTLQNVDGSLMPNGTVLMSKTADIPFNSDTGRLDTFSSPASVVAGQRYAWVFENIHSSPTSNFYSVDCLWGGARTLLSANPRFHGIANEDLALLRRVGSGSWSETAFDTESWLPIMDVGYTSGQHQGFGYMEFWGNANPSGPLRKTVTGSSNKCRERIIPSQDVAIKSIWCAAKRINSGTNALVIELQNASRTPIETLTIPAATNPVRTISESNYRAADDIWGGNLSQTRTLQQGQTYYIEFRVAGGGSTQYSFMAMRRGVDWDYHPSTYFADGRAYITSNDFSSQTPPVGWSGSTNYENDTDWKVYMETVGDGGSPPPGDVTPPTVESVAVTGLTETSAEITWDLDEVATGFVDYGTTTAYGSSTSGESSFDWDHHVQPITGLSPGTLYHFRVRGADPAGNAYQSSDQTFTTSGSGGGVAATRWGVGLSGNTLHNTMAGSGTGSTGNPIAFSFRAKKTGNISYVRVFYMNQTDYGAGNPTLTVAIQKDDGSAAHVPDGTNLATPTSFSNQGGTDVDHLFTLGADPPVTGGELYHVVFTNTSSDTSANKFSLDNFNGSQSFGGHSSVEFDGRRNPILPNEDFKVLAKNGSWSTRTGHWPIIEIGYADGDVQGWSYMEVEYSNGADYASFPLEISGTTYIRQRFTVPTGGLPVVGAGVRLSRTSGSSAVLTVELQNSSRTPLGSFTLPASTFPVGTADAVEDAPDWGYGEFASAVDLTGGQTYFLELRCSSSSRFFARGLRKDYGSYDSRTFIPGYAEASSNSGSAWSGGTKIWGGGITQLTDIPFFLETEASEPASGLPPEGSAPSGVGPAMAMPGYLTPSTYPGMDGQEVVRISNVLKRRNRYANRSAWSRHETFLYLDRDDVNGDKHLLDGHDYSMVEQDTAARSLHWSNHDTWGDTGTVARAFGIFGSAWRVYEATAGGGFDQIASFTLPVAAQGGVIGNDEGNGSNNDRFAIMHSDDQGVTVIQANQASGITTLGTRTFGTTLNNCFMSQDGNWVVIQFGSSGTGSTQGTKAYPVATFGTATAVHLSSAEDHGDCGVDSSGNQVFVMQSGTTMRMYRLSNAAATTVLSGIAEVHVSCRALDRPGWAYISSFRPTGSWDGYGRVLAVKLDGSETVMDFGPHYNLDNPDVYERSPFACPSPTGTRVTWASAWDSPGTGGVSPDWHGFVSGMAV